MGWRRIDEEECGKFIGNHKLADSFDRKVRKPGDLGVMSCNGKMEVRN